MSTAIVKIPSLKTGDDKEVAERFVELFTDAQNGLRRIVAFGCYAWQVKLLALKHGQFGPWMKAHVEPKGVSYRSVRGYMNLTRSTLEGCGIKLKPSLANWQQLPISHCGEFLLLPDSKVPPSVKAVREKIFSVIDGKSARQLFTEFKQCEDDESDFPKPKRGRLKGQGGASKAQRLAASEAEEKARITEMELSAKDFGKWIDEVCDAKGLGKISDRAFDALSEKAELLWQLCRQLKAARKTGGAK